MTRKLLVLVASLIALPLVYGCTAPEPDEPVSEPDESGFIIERVPQDGEFETEGGEGGENFGQCGCTCHLGQGCMDYCTAFECTINETISCCNKCCN
jgi:hypothetical protein